MGVLREKHANEAHGFSAFLAKHLPLFSLNFLGLVAVRIWIQVDLYDRYTSTDSGIITIVANLLRVGLTIIMLAVVIRRGFSPRAQTILLAISAVAMTAASALFLLQSVYESQLLVVAACVLAGFGIIWGGGIWICFYIRLEPAEALLYAFLSLAASSFFGLFLGLVPENIAFLVAMFMPALSCIAYRRAQLILDARKRCEGDALSSTKDPVYNREPRSTFVRLLVGIALFNFALGVARGFPSGASIELSAFFQAVHQFAAVGLSLGIVAWALVKNRSLKFSSLWNITVTLIAVGVLVLAAMNEALSPFGATLIAIANTFSLGLLWYSCYDIARQSSWKAYVILGIGWTAHILPREIGRALIWVAEPHTTEAVAITAVIVCLLAASMAFLLNDSIPRTRPLFADFRKQTKGLVHDLATRAQARAEGTMSSEALNDAASPATSAADQPPQGESSAKVKDTLSLKLEALKQHYFLTDRELEVIALLAQGRSKTAIGKKLFLSENTVKTYVKNVYTKLDIHTKQELLDRIEEQLPSEDR